MKTLLRTLLLGSVLLAAGCVVEPIGPGPGYYTTVATTTVTKPAARPCAVDIR